MGEGCVWGIEQFRAHLDVVLWVGEELTRIGVRATPGYEWEH